MPARYVGLAVYRIRKKLYVAHQALVFGSFDGRVAEDGIEMLAGEFFPVVPAEA
jgi:hypothetical protein